VGYVKLFFEVGLYYYEEHGLSGRHYIGIMCTTRNISDIAHTSLTDMLISISMEFFIISSPSLEADAVKDGHSFEFSSQYTASRLLCCRMIRQT
jgi:hypothetical protein